MYDKKGILNMKVLIEKEELLWLISKHIDYNALVAAGGVDWAKLTEGYGLMADEFLSPDDPTVQKLIEEEYDSLIVCGVVQEMEEF